MMYTIIETETQQWVTEASIGKIWEPGDTHVTMFLPHAAVFHDRNTAHRAKKIVEERFPGRCYKTAKLDI